MPTLKESIDAEVNALRTERDAIDAKIAAAEAQVKAFEPWLQHELGAAEAAIKAFFNKFKPKVTDPS